MPFFDIEYRRPVVIPSVPQDRVMETPWRLIKRWEADSPEQAIKEFKQIQKDFNGYEPEVKSIQESAQPSALEELGAML